MPSVALTSMSQPSGVALTVRVSVSPSSTVTLLPERVRTMGSSWAVAARLAVPSA